ncbi:pentatricopeptide repeat-containing protein At1g71460, chloroplastic [Silene latifolia]|uniref:pentatricopeptide repeat-containing protein At1g71460, chloroplastic n=1 Tax=Silene latifolia TaxID=37657 RepID=UPI003D77A359
MAILTATISSSSRPPPYPSFPAKSKPKINPNNFSTAKNPNKTQQSSINFNPKTPKKYPKKDENQNYPWSIPLHKKHPHAIYKDIQKFAQKNKIKEALTILDYLEKLGIPVNVTTFSNLIGACIRSKSLFFAKQIHAHIRINGLENNEFIKLKIVQMYASCGSLDDAKRLVFNDGDEKCESVYAWNGLLRGNVVSGLRKFRELLELYGRMREIGVEMNEYSYSCMIKGFGGSKAFKLGLKIHGLLIKNGFIGSEILKTSLIDMYFKCRKIKLARMMFDEMSERDVVVWGAMVAGFAHNGMPGEAIYFVRWMIQEGIVPNSVVLTTLLPVIGEFGALKLGKEVHGFVFKIRSYLDHPFVKSGLIDMYCKCGDMNSGRKVFYTSRDRTTVSWTALISGYVCNGRLDQALRSIIWMQQEGFRPDVVSVATVLPVCAELRALREGKEIHGYLVKNGFLPNVSLITSLIVMYSKCGVLQYSRRLFDKMEFRNVISWTAFITCCIQTGYSYEALEVFRSMQLATHRADHVTISSVLGICCEFQLLKLGKEIHGQILKKGIERVPYIVAGLMKFYGRCGLIEKAKSLFDLCTNKGSMTRTAMICAYGYNNYFTEALAVFDQLVDDGVTPHINTIDEVLTVCDQAGFADEACRIAHLVTERYKMSVSNDHYCLIAGILSRSGRVEEAERYMQWSSRLESLTGDNP